MKVTLEVTLDGNVVLPVTAEVAAFTDLPKLAKKVSDFATGVRRILPDIAAREVKKVRIVTE